MSGSLDEEDTSLLTLRIKDKEYSIQRRFLNFSGFVKQMVMNDRARTVFDLIIPDTIHHVFSSMDLILQYYEYHDQYGPSDPISKPLKSEFLDSSEIGAWDIAFIDRSDQELTDLANLANYMDIPSILDLCCAKIGSIMRSIMNQYPTHDQQINMVRKRWHGEHAK